MFDRPSCTFSAARFVGGCNADWFDPKKACAGNECGGIVGCGECDAGSVLLRRAVRGSRHAARRSSACGQEWMCSTGNHLQRRQVQGDCRYRMRGATRTHLCDLQVTYCASPEPANPGDPPPPAECMAAKDNDAACKEQNECKSQHCGLPLDKPFATSKICLDPTEMYLSCADTGSCEPGSYCDGKRLPADEDRALRLERPMRERKLRDARERHEDVRRRAVLLFPARAVGLKVAPRRGHSNPSNAFKACMGSSGELRIRRRACTGPGHRQSGHRDFGGRRPHRHGCSR